MGFDFVSGVLDPETALNIMVEQKMWLCINTLGIKPFKDGNQWCFLYGENLQDGIAGFGDTIFEAAWDFYTQIG